MTPKSYFDNVWNRADLFTTLHAYMNNNAAAALDTLELLRAEWAIRVSALDLYVHELVIQNLVEIFVGSRPLCPGFAKLKISGETLLRVRAAGTGAASRATFELAVREHLSRVTYQAPDDIAEGVRLISPIELWNEVAKYHGAVGSSIKPATKAIKLSLTQIVNRRNKIVHEGDLQPATPRTPWPIATQDLQDVKTTILDVVNALEAIV